MSKTKTRYVCQNCGKEQYKWMGQCPGCGEWNTLEGMVVSPSSQGRRDGRSALFTPAADAAQPQPINQIRSDDFQRIPVGSEEWARVLGGGIVPGSGILIGGDPGIGKSTLLLQLCAYLAERVGEVLYVSGEESAQQVRLRAERLGILNERLLVLPEIHLESILSHIESTHPRLVVIDSIQAVYSEYTSSSAGSVTQVRDCASHLLRLAKGLSVPVFLVGHVTKEGAIAGPRVLEHMVDTVLYLEGERFHAYRLLRCVKNRFGSTDEVGVFEMSQNGLVEVTNPSEAFLAERLPNSAGSAIAVPLEGTRPLLVEVQALTSVTSFSQPRRTGNGVDFNRLLLLVAVLSKRVGLRLSDQDVFVNVVGGMRVSEPAADLAIAVAIASSFRNAPVAADLAVLGEVGLSSELRSVSQLSRRLAEAAKLGFKRALVPKSARRRRGDPLAQPVPDASRSEVEVIAVRSVQEALDIALVR